MAGVNNVEDQSCEPSEIILSLLAVLGEQTLHHELKRHHQPVDVDESEKLKPVCASVLAEDKQIW